MKRLFILVASLSLCACGSLSNLSQPSITKSDESSAKDVSASQASQHQVNQHINEPRLKIVEVHQPNHGLIETLAKDFSWDRHLDTPEVQKRIRTYKNKPEQFKKILARSSDILPLIVEQLEDRNLPAELAFLPLVESGYQTNIRSSAGAAGLWQLMPATARHLGMKIDWWYDERLDIQTSTEKALDYLEYLNKQFSGDWELTITAYNGGEGHVRSQMRKAKSKNFWDLSLKRETEDYLPRLLAVAELLSKPEHYNIDTPQIEHHSRLRSIKLDQQIDLRLAASTAGIEYKAFKKLNPSFQRWVSPPKGKYQILLPEEQVKLLAGKLSGLQPNQLASWDHYQVKSGDTLIDIARQFGTTVRSLIAVNELSNSRIYARQELLIPKAETRAIKARSDTIKELYIVKSGDSLWKIAYRNDITINKLKKLNSMGKKSVIQPGQVLILNEYFDGTETTYEVKRGDSLSEIAYQFDIAITDLKTWNSLGKKDLIHPGQLLKIRIGS